MHVYTVLHGDLVGVLKFMNALIFHHLFDISVPVVSYHHIPHPCGVDV